MNPTLGGGQLLDRVFFTGLGEGVVGERGGNIPPLVLLLIGVSTKAEQIYIH